MSLFEYVDYVKFIRDKTQSAPKGGHGQLTRIAEHLNINTVSVSQIMHGKRDLNLDQALDLAEFFGLNKLETDYFLLLVQIARAASLKLKNRLLTQLEALRLQSKDLRTRISDKPSLTEEQKAIFYSNWYFSGIRLLTDINEFQNVDAISERLKLPKSQVRDVVEFLIQNNLCEEISGKLKLKTTRTHLEASSPLSTRHHSNWRLKGLEKMSHIQDDEMFYTCPMVLSQELMLEVRKELFKLIDQIFEKIDKSKSETTACLNIDWFKW